IYLEIRVLNTSWQGEFQRRLYRELLSEYTPLERPVSKDADPLPVYFTMAVRQVMDMDEKNQVLTTNIWLQMYWFDQHLHWNLSDYPGVTTLRFPADKVWTPDILLYNSADDRFDGTFHTSVLCNYTGGCQYIPPGILRSTCEVNVRWFPFDIQRCDLKFGSWTHDGWLVELHLLPVDLSGYTPNGEWELVGVPGKLNLLFYNCCAAPYPDITFTITIRRRTLYYALNLLVPCVLISSLSLFVFLLPAESGEKISLGITVLLSLTVFMLLVAEIMPATSDSVPLIAQYFACTMIIVGMSVVATVVVLRYHHQEPNGTAMPQWTRVFLLQWCAWFLRMRRPGQADGPPFPRLGGNHLSTNSYPSFKTFNQTYAQHQHDHSCFTLGQHPSSSSASSPPQPPRVFNPKSNGKDGGLEGYRKEERKYMTGTGEIDCGSADSFHGIRTRNLIAEHLCAEGAEHISEDVAFLAERMREQERDEETKAEWKFAAAIIDRLCLVTFSVFTVVCTVAMLISAPNFATAISKDFL
uniref:neuronal acetylcholine receptor subunit alpha-7-like n=1 Tax=Myxine glutinosa TaxID=7769 RepID=UPI00358F72F0